MATVMQLIPPTTDERLAKFDDFWRLYPHHANRRSKADCRKLFMEITSPQGCLCRHKPRGSDQYEETHRQATAEEIIAGVKEYRTILPRKSPDSYTLDTTYVEDACVWLRGGRWEI